ncbi:OsmC family protein [Limnobacter litoralis]|uniref:Peroxiredoxin n=1 Tax=Limnobacter litoralis TaxID=481366 RepID=A0ABQ5YTH7_9BURK|nr:OsmC family protein [Limnobacter litoralis]GLR26752.1 hypothetical protein GCM10007875_18420 [Limnobacter litoralis]
MTQVTVVQKHAYQTEVHFAGNLPVLTADEPAPIGTGTGPSPIDLLASAVGNCLLASLYFALTKFKNAPAPMRCEVSAEQGKNAEGKTRVLGITANIHLADAPESLAQLDRILGQFEEFCTVTRSVAAGIPVVVSVFDPNGNKLK